MDPTSPPSSEGGSPRPFPCTVCGSTRGYSRVVKFRVQCLNCNSLLANDEVNFEDQAPLGEN
jgi:hypothetical protein